MDPHAGTGETSQAFLRSIQELQLLHLREVRKLREDNRQLMRELVETKGPNNGLPIDFPTPLIEPSSALQAGRFPVKNGVTTEPMPTVVKGMSPNDTAPPLPQAASQPLALTESQGAHASVLSRMGTRMAPPGVRRASIVIQEFFQPSVEEQKKKPMSYLERFFKSDAFDLAVGVVILCNAVCIAIETVNKGNTPLWLDVAEYVFLTVYAIELSIAFWFVGPRFALRSNWVKFDVFLVSCGIFSGIVRGINGDDSMMDAVLLVRMLRLARIARVLRIMRMFKTLWRLVHGLMHAIVTLIWTFVLLFLLLFTFAIIGMEVITEDSSFSEAYNRVVKSNFGTLWETCITLVQVVTLDSIGPIYRPLLEENPMLSVYFFIFMLLVSIALMNLVTAIMVESALDKSAADKEVMRMWEMDEKQKRVDRIREIFVQMDADKSGKLTLEELTTAPEALKKEFAELVEIEDFEMLFQLLDYEGRGAVNIREFCDGIDKICRGKLEMFSLMFQGHSIMKKQSEILSVVHELKEIRIMETMETFESFAGGFQVLSAV
mmetsp:Transcript_35204/g.79436  ORF Transcript_35204/g.79436 Transcript_35204/m.79436 type:complete len:547 (-) Transcript_35204:18-1658(-)